MSERKEVQTYIQWAVDCPKCGKTELLDCGKENVGIHCVCGEVYDAVWEEL